MKFPSKDYFSKYGTADLVTFTQEILKGKHLCSEIRNLSTNVKHMILTKVQVK